MVEWCRRRATKAAFLKCMGDVPLPSSNIRRSSPRFKKRGVFSRGYVEKMPSMSSLATFAFRRSPSRDGRRRTDGRGGGPARLTARAGARPYAYAHRHNKLSTGRVE